MASLLSITVDKDGTATAMSRCCICEKESVVSGIPVEPLKKWLRAEGLIQDLLPTLTEGQRETLLSGLHEPCFDKAFGGEDA